MRVGAGALALLAGFAACSPSQPRVPDASVPDASVPDLSAVTCQPGNFWPCSYNPACAAVSDAPPDHSAYTSSDCLSCHSPDGGSALRFLFGGVVWNPSTHKGGAKVEVGVRSGAVFYSACSDPNGFFFVPASAGEEPDWTQADSRIRTWLGEKIMPANEPHGPGCNGAAPCHGSSTNPLLAPL